MAAKTDKTKRKQLSRGERKHVRRMKQEARRTSIPENPIKKTVPVPVGIKE
jgi:hypothetical protein